MGAMKLCLSPVVNKPRDNNQRERQMTSSATNAPLDAAPRVIARHSLLVRLTHWINALCFAFLLMSGLQIFNAHPALNFGNRTEFDHPLLELSARENADGDIKGVTTIFGHSFNTTGLLGASRDASGEIAAHGFPGWATIPSYQDLATGRRWHFFFAWILAINGLVYFINLFARRHIGDFIPTLSDWRDIPHAIVEHARLRFPKGDSALHYNVLQKLAYLSVIIAFPVLILAGLTMSPGMDSTFPWLLSLFGGRQSARTIHFIAAFYLVGFIVVHIAMVLLSGFFNNMRSMITGRYRIEEDTHEP
jgi:thiosulfate reductase cytochrome b subunit